MNWLDLQEVVAGLELGCGEGYGSSTADSMSGDPPDAARDVPQASDHGVAMGVHRLGDGGCCGMEGLNL
jgi:hypothetical protein